jgi:ferrous iron transport protein B
MATRTLENKNDRLLTMLINPFMSCSARLPVYILLIGAFFPAYSGSILFLLYFIGIAVAVLMAILLKKTIFKAKEAPIVMELPPYRVPTLRSTTIHMWSKGAQYLKKMGGVILIASILIWALGYYPVNVPDEGNFNKKNSEITKDIETRIAIAELEKNADSIRFLTSLKADRVAELENIRKSEKQENSYIGRMGKFIEPVIEPLGFDWKMGVSLLAGVAAKEIVVSTMAVLYQADEAGVDDLHPNHKKTLIYILQNNSGNLNNPKITPLSAFSFMLFILLYFPCIATIVAVKKESGSWKWALFTMFYTTAIAWLVSFLVYQIGSLFI